MAERSQSYHADKLRGHSATRMSYARDVEIETKELAVLKSKLGGVPVKIYFLDNSSKTFVCDRNATFRSLSVEILSKLGDDNAEGNARLFGIFQSHNGVMGVAGAPDQSVADMVISYGDANFHSEAKKLVFMIRLFTPMLQSMDTPQVPPFRAHTHVHTYNCARAHTHIRKHATQTNALPTLIASMFPRWFT